MHKFAFQMQRACMYGRECRIFSKGRDGKWEELGHLKPHDLSWNEEDYAIILPSEYQIWDAMMEGQKFAVAGQVTGCDDFTSFLQDGYTSHDFCAIPKPEDTPEQAESEILFSPTEQVWFGVDDGPVFKLCFGHIGGAMLDLRCAKSKDAFLLFLAELAMKIQNIGIEVEENY